MTVSGQMTKWRRFSIRLMEIFTGLFCGGGLVGFFLLVSRLLAQYHWQPPDRNTRIAVIAGGVVVGVLAFALSRWLDADVVVEFACDGRSFRFRKVGRKQAETRGLSEIAKVSRGTGRPPLRHRVIFRDGSQAVLCCGDLPNAEVIAEWLDSHSQGG
ncbi:MAG TPA: hypothetical protein VKF41_09680 [Bryobacteraceae bacterium]|nr:hypothetical protein [Bryobacteraceae bacterium]